MKLFKIIDYVKDDGVLTLFCSKNGSEFEINFQLDRFMIWLKDTDRLNTRGNVMEGNEHVGYFDSIMSEDEYWGTSEASIIADLYEYVVLRLIAPHELFNGTEKSLIKILTENHD